MNKAILVTGAAGGIGRATCQLLKENGFTVIGMDLAENVFDFDYLRGDLSKSADRTNAIRYVTEKYGALYGLVNVAGVAPRVRNDILEMTEESYDFVMDINTKGTFFLTQAAANEMIKNGAGVIVNISSMSAYTSSVSRGEYCISKAGVSMITKLFADRLAEHHITVNEIRPGIIATGMTDAVKAKYDALIENGLLPIKRWGQPEDIARAVLSLCNGSLPYMTGQSLDIDGGFHIRRL